MSDNVIIFIAAIYATIVALSARKVGFIAAALFPVTIILLGIFQYVLIATYPSE